MKILIDGSGKRIVTMLKALFICAFTLIMMSLTSMTAHAQEISEVESNDTADEAQLIFANSETAAGCVNGSYVGQRVINGTISSSDTDWYKVSLSAGTQYITSNGASYDFVIYSENDLENSIYQGSYVNVGLGITATPFYLSSGGTYYVKLTGVSSSSESYKLMIGSPTYSLSEYTEYLGYIQMEGVDEMEYADLRYYSSIPNGSIVYSFSIYNLVSSSSNGVIVENWTSGNSYTLPASNLTKTISAYSNVPLKAEWTFTIKYKKTVTINPRVTFRYVYPVTSHLVN